jgi:tetratricopeptide (TPR) repeat protein
MSRAISLNPQEALAYYNRGLIYERKDSLDRAIIDFSTAIRLDPYRYIFYKDRGKALVWKQMYAEAEQDFSKALDLDATDPEMWFRRSLARVSQDKFREGLEDALIARKLGMEVSEDFIKGLTRQILESDSAFMK